MGQVDDGGAAFPIEHRIANDYATAIDNCKTAKDAAALYADGLATYGPDGMAWRTVNGAILNRWSPSTLERIKRSAWRTLKEKLARRTPGAAQEAKPCES